MATLTEQIKIALARRDGVPEEAMRQLAAAYSTEVARVHERLSKAVALLRKGLRSEAIQLASMAPNAIDLAANLDFPEFSEWCEVLQFYGIPVPDELQRDLVEQVNEAIVEALPLEETLRQHRRLAIARAPLPWRLRTLRRIAKLDPQNPVWEDDLERWETARLQRLGDEVREAIKSSDPAKLDAVQQELTQSEWRVQPNEKLVRSVQNEVLRREQVAIHEEMKTVAGHLREAFCEFDEPSARRWLARWQQLVARSTSAPPADLVEEDVSPISAWLKQIDDEAAEQAARSAALSVLERQLSRPHDRAALDGAYNACGQFDGQVPQELVNRYRLQIEQFELRDRRRNQAILASVFALAVIAIGTLVFWQRAAAFEKSVVIAQDRLAPLLSAGQLSEAESFWTKLEETSPAVVNDPRLIALSGQLNELRAVRDARIALFNEYLVKATVESPDAMDFSALAKAEELATTELEKDAAFQVRTQYTRWSQAIESEQTTGLLAAIAQIRGQLDELERSPMESVEMSKFPELAAELEIARANHPRAAASAKSQVAPTSNRIHGLRDALRDRRTRMRSEADGIRRITSATTLSGLEQQLQEFARLSPESPLAKEFASAASGRKHWDRITEWNDLVTDVARAIRGGLTGDQAKSLAGRYSSLSATLLDHPAAKLSTNEIGSPWHERLTDFDKRLKLASSLLGDLQQTVYGELYTLVETEGGKNRAFIYKAFYDQNRSTFVTELRTQGVEVIANGAGAVQRKSLTGPFQSILEPHGTIRWLANVHDTSATKIAADWEREMLKLVGQCRNREGLDSQIKEMLIQHLLAGACRGSDYLTNQLVDELLLLSERAPARENWYQLAPPSDVLEPEVDRRITGRAKSLYESLDTTSAVADRLMNSTYQWVGCLLRDDEGNAYASLQPIELTNGWLVVARSSATTSEATDLAAVARVVDGNVRMRDDPSVLIAGSPVYFLANHPTTVSP